MEKDQNPYYEGKYLCLLASRTPVGLSKAIDDAILKLTEEDNTIVDFKIMDVNTHSHEEIQLGKMDEIKVYKHHHNFMCMIWFKPK